jgi:hypothetical protein
MFSATLGKMLREHLKREGKGKAVKKTVKKLKNWEGDVDRENRM